MQRDESLTPLCANFWATVILQTVLLGALAFWLIAGLRHAHSNDPIVAAQSLQSAQYIEQSIDAAMQLINAGAPVELSVYGVRTIEALRVRYVAALSNVAEQQVRLNRLEAAHAHFQLLWWGLGLFLILGMVLTTAWQASIVRRCDAKDTQVTALLEHTQSWLST